MPTECAQACLNLHEGRAVVASFDGGRITSDAGAPLLGAADRVIGLTRKLAACFTDRQSGVHRT
jgi:Transposase DDE domain group 1